MARKTTLLLLGLHTCLFELHSHIMHSEWRDIHHLLWWRHVRLLIYVYIYIYIHIYIYGFPDMGIPQNESFIMENPIKIDDLGAPPSQEMPYIYIYIHRKLAMVNRCQQSIKLIQFWSPALLLSNQGVQPMLMPYQQSGFVNMMKSEKTS